VENKIIELTAFRGGRVSHPAKKDSEPTTVKGSNKILIEVIWGKTKKS